MKQFYNIEVAGLSRELPVCKLNDDLCIAGFIIVGDSELSEACAKALMEKLPEYDVLLTAESKGIPLAHEVARQSGKGKYIVARKGVKAYMPDPIFVDVNSITTKGRQTLVLDRADTNKIKGQRVVLIDDVISTGNSLSALERIVNIAGGSVVGKAAILAEGDAADRTDIIFLEKLPLLDSNGEPI